MMALFSFVTCFLQFSQVSGYLGNVSNDNSDRSSASPFWLVRRRWIRNCRVKGRKLRRQQMSKGCLEDWGVRALVPLGTAGTPCPTPWARLPLPGGTACRVWAGGYPLPGEDLQRPGKAALLGAEKWGNRTISRAMRAHLWKYSRALLILSKGAGWLRLLRALIFRQHLSWGWVAAEGHLRGSAVYAS